MFFAASANERRLILLNLDIVAPMPAGRVSFARDPEISRRFEAAALARNREEFAQHLAQSLHISREQARRIANDDLGEPIVMAAKALAMPRDVVLPYPAFRQSRRRSFGRARSRARGALRRDDVASGRGHGCDLAIACIRRNTPQHSIGRYWDDEARARAPRRRQWSAARPRRIDRTTPRRFLARRLSASRRYRESSGRLRSSTSTIQMSGSNLISRAR